MMGEINNSRPAIDKLAETLGSHSGHSQIEIVIQELSPLHQHVRVNFIRCCLRGGNDPRGN